MKKEIFIFLLLAFATLILAEIIIDEDFSGVFPPGGWTTFSSSGQINWQQGTGSNAGGTAPEAEFCWSPSTTAVQKLISLPVNTVGAASLDLEFIHTNNDFSGDYTIRLETTSDGNNWNIVTTFPSSDFTAVQEQITIINSDVGSPTFQLAWVFDGNSFNINYWYIDNIILSGTLITYNDDLAATGIDGATVVNAGKHRQASPNGVLRIAHSPTKRSNKGTTVFLKAIEDLKKKGYQIEAILIEKKSHREALEMKVKADACFDSFWLGMQVSGLESACFEQPVLAGDEFIQDKMVELYGYCPYTFVTEDTLEEQIENLICYDQFYKQEQ